MFEKAKVRYLYQKKYRAIFILHKFKCLPSIANQQKQHQQPEKKGQFKISANENQIRINSKNYNTEKVFIQQNITPQPTI